MNGGFVLSLGHCFWFIEKYQNETIFLCNIWTTLQWNQSADKVQAKATFSWQRKFMKDNTELKNNQAKYKSKKQKAKRKKQNGKDRV